MHTRESLLAFDLEPRATAGRCICGGEIPILSAGHGTVRSYAIGAGRCDRAGTLCYGRHMLTVRRAIPTAIDRTRQ